MFIVVVVCCCCYIVVIISLLLYRCYYIVVIDDIGDIVDILIAILIDFTVDAVLTVAASRYDCGAEVSSTLSKVIRDSWVVAGCSEVLC